MERSEKTIASLSAEDVMSLILDMVAARIANIHLLSFVDPISHCYQKLRCSPIIAGRMLSDLYLGDVGSREFDRLGIMCAFYFYEWACRIFQNAIITQMTFELQDWAFEEQERERTKSVDDQKCNDDCGPIGRQWAESEGPDPFQVRVARHSEIRDDPKMKNVYEVAVPTHTS